jgi:hypothetical protein
MTITTSYIRVSDGSGTWVVYALMDGGSDIYRVRTDGTGWEALTTWGASNGHYSQLPDISADGTKIVYHSNADPLGTNPENNREIFLYDTEEETTDQLTTAGGSKPRISPNGAFVVFRGVWTEPVGTEIYRLERATGDVRLASAGIYTTDWLDTRLGYDVDNDGNMAFYGDGDLVGRNPDESWEIWLAEFDEASQFEVGADHPTVLSWDPLPWALGYDVIRGDLAALAPGLDNTVDLGAVVCIENDSDDANTVGNEDAAIPSAGQGFFYLYRPNPGDLVGANSLGQGTGGLERVSASGDCPTP